MIVNITSRIIRENRRLFSITIEYMRPFFAWTRAHNPKVVGLCLLLHNPCTCRTISLKIRKRICRSWVPSLGLHNCTKQIRTPSILRFIVSTLVVLDKTNQHPYGCWFVFRGTHKKWTAGSHTQRQDRCVSEKLPYLKMLGIFYDSRFLTLLGGASS